MENKINLAHGADNEASKISNKTFKTFQIKPQCLDDGKQFLMLEM